MLSNSSDEESSDEEIARTETTLIPETLPLPPRYIDSPTSSLSDVEVEEDQERKEKLMLYVFVLRCVAHPFNAKQQTDMARRQNKIAKQELSLINARFEKFLNGLTKIESDKAFHNSVKLYFDTFLNGDRVLKMVSCGCCTAGDFREVFKSSIEKRVRNLPVGLNFPTKETVLSSWMAKFDSIYRGEEQNAMATRSPARMTGATATSEMILSKDQLYEMFQTIIGIKRLEHQILYNACQLDNADEQAVCIRRELQGRMSMIEKRDKVLPGFVHKNMKVIYVDELKGQINQLKTNLDSLPVSNVKTKPLKSTALVSDLSEPERVLSPSDVVLSFTIEVLVIEAKGLKLPAQKIVYCTMEVDGGEKFQTDQAEASRPKWDTQGDFTTTHPLPEVKIKLLAESTGVLAFDDKELAKLTCHPSPGFSEDSRWYEAIPIKGGPTDKIQIKMRVKMDKPLNLKKCGYVYSQGMNVWKRWKRRYYVLVQVSQYTFALCSYHDKKGEPNEMIQLDGYTVDYSDIPADDEHIGGKYFFCCVKEGNSVTFSTDDESDRQMWVHKISQATGQSHRPVAPKLLEPGTPKTNSLTRLLGDTDRARKFGLDEAIQAEPCEVDHNRLFKLLQYLTLEHRLNDTYSCLGWFSPGQLFVLDEYCARYGVRGCYRHLYYLLNLLDKAESGIMIDSTLLHYSYAFCASHVHGNRPDGTVTITTFEMETFEEVKERLWHLLTNQITNFRYSFPFGRPEGGLKATLSLFERVMMKDISTPVPPEEFRAEMRKCLQQASLVNYTKVSKFVKIEDFSSPSMKPSDHLEAIYELADYCIDLLQQNEEHHGEALEWFSTLMVEHTELFWSLFTVDLDAALDVQPEDTWDSFSLFQLLNEYFTTDVSLRNGTCHNHLQNKFAPLVVRYVDLMESSIAQSVHNGFEKESWTPVGEGCTSSEDMFYKLCALKGFIDDLHWPEREFSAHLARRIEFMSSDMIEACVKRVREAFSCWLKRGRFNTEYVMPQQMCVMFNVLSQAKKQANDMCKGSVEFRQQCGRGDAAERLYHTDVREILIQAEDFLITEFVEKIDVVLEGLLKKLSRYDQGTIKSHLFSLANEWPFCTGVYRHEAKPIGCVPVQNGHEFCKLLLKRSDLAPNDEARISYLQFCQSNLVQMKNCINDYKIQKKLLKNWYNHLMKLIVMWLTDRISLKLHPYQIHTLFPLVKSFPEDFAVYGLDSSRILHSSNYSRVHSRLQVEEAIESGESSILLPNDTERRYSDSDEDSDFSDEDE